jgi:hypothetical protein
MDTVRGRAVDIYCPNDVTRRVGSSWSRVSWLCLVRSWRASVVDTCDDDRRTAICGGFDDGFKRTSAAK